MCRYSDDMEIDAKNRNGIHQASHKNVWALENGFEVSKDRLVQMVPRKGSKISNSNRTYVENNALQK